MIKNILRRGFCIFMSLVLALTISTTGMAANNENMINAVSDEMQEIAISMTAGENGVYVHNIDTGETEFIPPAQYESCGGLDLVQEEGAEGDSIIEPNFINNFTAITSPSGGRYQSTCLIGARFVQSGKPDFVAIGTGWLLDYRYVMTAGHLLFRKDYGYAHHVAVYVGASGGTYKQYRLGHYLHVGENYISNACTSEGGTVNYGSKGMYDDWGIIKMDSKLTIDPGHLGRYVVSEYKDMANRDYYVQGYPKSEQTATRWNDYTMYRNSGRMKGQYNDSVWTDMQFGEGISGGPVYSYRNGAGYAAEGIAVSSSDDLQKSIVVLYNSKINNYINKYCI